MTGKKILQLLKTSVNAMISKTVVNRFGHTFAMCKHLKYNLH